MPHNVQGLALLGYFEKRQPTTEADSEPTAEVNNILPQ
jgi:hypothetical protein